MQTVARYIAIGIVAVTAVVAAYSLQDIALYNSALKSKDLCTTVSDGEISGARVDKSPANDCKVVVSRLNYWLDTYSQWGTGKLAEKGKEQSPPVLIKFSRAQPIHDLARAISQHLKLAPTKSVGDFTSLSLDLPDETIDRLYCGVRPVDRASPEAMLNCQEFTAFGEVEMTIPGVGTFHATRSRPRMPGPLNARLMWSGIVDNGLGKLVMVVGQRPPAITATLFLPDATISIEPARGAVPNQYSIDVIEKPSFLESEEVRASPERGKSDVVVPALFDLQCKEDTERDSHATTSTQLTHISLLPIISAFAEQNYDGRLEDQIRTQAQFLNDALWFSGTETIVDVLQPIVVSAGYDSAASEMASVSQLANIANRFAASSDRTSLLKQNIETNEFSAYRQILKLRQDAKAQLAVVFSDYMPKDTYGQQLCGQSAAVGATSIAFFSLVKTGKLPNVGSRRVCLQERQTFSHEVAHLLGARHEIEDSDETLPPISHGYIRAHPYRAEEFIGTLESSGTGTAPHELHRLVRFSNAASAPCTVARITDKGPTYQAGDGMVLGRAAKADTVGIMRENAKKIARISFAPSQFAELSGDEVACSTLTSACVAPVSGCRELPPEMKNATFHFDRPSRNAVLQLSGKDKDRLGEFATSSLAPLLQERASTVRAPRVIVAGFADSYGSEASNFAVSLARADYVRTRLRGALAGANQFPQIFVCGYSNARPRCSESSSVPALAREAAAENRRVEIMIAAEESAGRVSEHSKVLDVETWGRCER